VLKETDKLAEGKGGAQAEEESAGLG
jgi:hypothetical protein